MSDMNMIPVIEQLKLLKLEQEQLAEQIKALEDQVKTRMGEEETLTAGPHKVTYKAVTSSRLDTKALTADLGKDILLPYYRTSTTQRFCVA